MSRFAFAVLPAVGHVNPMISIAHELREQGHEIIFVCFAPDVIREHVEANGFRLEGIPGMPPSLFRLVEFLMKFPRGYLEFLNGIGAMFSRLTYVARNVIRVLERLEPDMVVVDFTFPGACIASEKLGMPFTVIYHAGLCFKGPGVPPFGTGLPIGGEWGWRGRLYSRISELLEGKITFSMGMARKRLGLPARPADIFLSSLGHAYQTDKQCLVMEDSHIMRCPRTHRRSMFPLEHSSTIGRSSSGRSSMRFPMIGIGSLSRPVGHLRN